MHEFWHLITRLGDAHIVLPLGLLAWVGLVRHDATRMFAQVWGVGVVVCVSLVTLSKLAFLGWGVGSAALNFTGVSGHASDAALVWPVLLGTLASRLDVRVQRVAVVLGFVLALLIGLSRIAVQAHSWSETIAGLLMGGAVSALALRALGLPRGANTQAMAALVAVWLVLVPLLAPRFNTHNLVVRVALALSGNATVYTRADLAHLP